MRIRESASGIAVATFVLLGASMKPVEAANPAFAAALSQGRAIQPAGDPGRLFGGSAENESGPWIQVRMSDGDRLAQAQKALQRGGSFRHSGHRPSAGRQPAPGPSVTPPVSEKLPPG